MNPSQITLFLTASFNLLLAIFILLKNPRNKLNISFSLCIIGISIWAFSLGMVQSFPTTLFLTLPFFAGILFSNAFIPFIQVFPSGNLKLKTCLYFWIPSLIVSFLLPTTLIVKGIVVNETGKTYPIRGDLYPLYIILIATIASYIVFSTIRKYSQTKGIDRKKLTFFYIGIIIFALCSLLLNIILPASGINSFTFIGPVFSLFLTISTAYSILRYRFLDIGFAIRQSVITAILILIFTIFFSLNIWLIEQFLGLITIKRIVFVASITSFFFVLIYNKLLSVLQSFFAQFLFQKEHSREVLVRTLGKTIHESIDLGNLLENIKDAIQFILTPSEIGFVIIEDKKSNEIKKFYLKNSFNEHLLLGIPRIFLERKDLLIKDEMKIHLQNVNQKSKLYLEYQEMIEIMEKNNFQVLVPLLGQKEIVGFIILGDKKYNDIYTTNDISVLEMIQYQAGIAIENALFYNETKSFSQKLKKEVTKATTDLKDKNKFLTVLRRIDQIIMNTKEIKNMCQKIADTVSWEMGFAGGLIALVNEKKNVLQAVAISDTPTFHDFFKALPKDIDKLSISLTENHSLLIKSIKENKIIVANTFSEAYSPPLDNKVIANLEAISEIRSHLICPISAKGKVLGLIVIGLGKKYEHLTPYENDLINTFLEEVGIALENLLLYEEIKRMNKYLVKANQELQELDKMKDEFVSVASHELRTPMTAIKGYAWMLEKGKHSLHLDERQKEYLNKITQSTERLISLVNDILNVSRIEGHKIQLNIQPAPIDELINNVISEIKPKAMEKNIILTYEKSQNTPLILMDKDRVYEVVMNLIGNAIKFTPEAGKISVFTKNDGKMLNISVKDTGRGIAKNDIPKLFRKFGRLEHSFSLISENSGSGLGLYISRSLVELHGGKIWVTSKVGEGSTFSFSLRKA